MSIPQMQDIERRFTYHKPFGTQPQRYEAIRNYAKSVALFVETNCPDSRERSLALTRLEEFVMWANASIARNEHERQETPAPPTVTETPSCVCGGNEVRSDCPKHGYK